MDVLAQQTGAALAARAWMLSCAESCTGGLLAGAITDVAGSSAWFDRGFVTYSNQAKMDELGVSPGTLEQHGAVSEATAREMAEGVLRASAAAHVALATTGIAGPGGATPGKPVGTVCFGFALRTASGIVTHASTQHFDGDRSQVRRAAVDYALRRLLDMLRV